MTVFVNAHVTAGWAPDDMAQYGTRSTPST